MDYQIKLIETETLRKTIDLCVKCFGEDWRKIAEGNFPLSLGEYPYKPNTFTAVDNDKVIGMSMVKHSH